MHLRGSLPRYGTCAAHLMSYLTTFSWRKKFGKGGFGFRNLIDHIKEIYNPYRENEDAFADIDVMDEYYVPPGVPKVRPTHNEEEEEVIPKKKKKVSKKKKRKRDESSDDNSKLTQRQLTVLFNKELEELKNSQAKRARKLKKKKR